jgi:putative Mg2+ transporter-C (MgtC) family protein
MLENWQIDMQLEFLIGIIIALAAGFVIGAERESRGKLAGISTNSLVIGSSMLFTYLCCY